MGGLIEELQRGGLPLKTIRTIFRSSIEKLEPAGRQSL